MNEILYLKIQEQLEIAGDANVVFWGASVFLKKFLENNSLDKKNIVGIIDNNEKLWGKKIGRYTIYPPLKLIEFKPIYVIFTIKNNNETIYKSVINQINKLGIIQVCIFPNIFIEEPLINKNNKIYLVKNDKKIEVDSIEGLDIIFKGENNIIEIGCNPLPKFINCLITVVDNNLVKIESSFRPIKYTAFRLEGKNGILKIGKDFYINGGEMILDSDMKIEIGDDCLFSHNIYIRAFDGHTIINRKTKEIINRVDKNSVSIGNHVWLGKDVTILKNSAIPDNTVVGTFSLVNKKFTTTNIILAGMPAKIIKTDIDWDSRTIAQYENL